MNIIESAVSHLKADAILRAEQNAIAVIEKIIKEFEKNEWCIDYCAPRPKSNMYNAQDAAKHQLYSSITTYTKHTLMPGEINIRKRSEKNEFRFINDAKENAAIQYDAFVSKLNAKIGPVKSAKLVGNHVWSESHLVVVTEKGEQQIWRTKMIINVSKLGRMFNQYPTRKVKNIR